MSGSDSDWVFDVDEVSANVFRVTGRDSHGRNVERTGTDPVALLAECRRDAAEITRTDERTSTDD